MGFNPIDDLSPPPSELVVTTPLIISNDPATSRVQLPTEIMSQIVQLVAESKDTRSILRLQRSSRQLYLLATPLLYLELGTSLRRIRMQLGALNDIFNPPYLPELVTIDSPDAQRHPVDCNRSTRLVWILSHVKRFIYRPRKRERYQDNQLELFHMLECLELLQQRKSQAMEQGRDAKLFPSLTHIIIDLSRIPPSDSGGDDASLPFSRMIRQRSAAELFEEEHLKVDKRKLVMGILRILAGRVSDTHVCLDMGSVEWSLELESILYRLECRSINFHRITRPKDVNLLLAVEKVILDFGMSPRGCLPEYHLRACTSITARFAKLMTCRSPPKMLVQRGLRSDEQRDKSDQDDGDVSDGEGGRKKVVTCFSPEKGDERPKGRTKFEKGMDRLLGSLRDDMGRKVVMKWGYVGKADNVERCNHCFSKSCRFNR